MKLSQGATSGLKPKAEVTPKVTLTKTSIVKSSPFLISRHHLDDTQMKQALRYEESESTCRIPRSYSYKGERITYQHSKLGPTPSHEPSRNLAIQPHRDDYYADRGLSSKLNANQSIQSNKQQDRARQQRSATIAENALHLKEQQALVQRMKANEEYGLKQMQKARKQLEKQAKKLRKAYKQKLQQRPPPAKENIIRLEQQVKELKIKALQLEKGRLLEDLDIRIKNKQQVYQKESAQQVRYNLSYLLSNKPKYKQPPSRGEDTDSSFSSIELT